MSGAPSATPPVVGELPPGHYTLTRDADARLREAMGAEGLYPGEAHPALAAVATLAADGLTIEELVQRCGAAMADGPLVGRCAMTFHRALRTDITYRVGRHVRTLVRKPSRSLGTMDVLELVITMTEPEGTPAAEVTYTWMLPK